MFPLLLGGSGSSLHPVETVTDIPGGEAELDISVPDDAKSSKTSSTIPTDPHIEIRTSIASSHNTVISPYSSPLTHPYCFTEFADATTTFLCRIYYAEEFHQLRQLVLPQGEMA